jgi:hypothetical protein
MFIERPTDIGILSPSTNAERFARKRGRVRLIDNVAGEIEPEQLLGFDPYPPEVSPGRHDVRT